MIKDMFSDVPEILRKFLQYQLTICGKSQNTVNEYCYDLCIFLRYVVMEFNPQETKNTEFEKIDIKNISADDLKKINLSLIYNYLSYISINRENSARTRARKVSSLRSFFKYLTEKAGLLDENPAAGLETPKSGKTLPVFLSLDESKALLNTVSLNGNLRDVCIITLFLNCGMRLSELIGINLYDIKDDTIRITGKGNKERTVYLNESSKTAINNYLRVRPKDGLKDPNALFISRNKRRINEQSVRNIVKKYIESAGLDPTRYSPHKLRHTAATLMYQYADADVLVLKELLGHENLSTTQIYTHVDNKQIKNVTNRHPLN